MFLCILFACYNQNLIQNMSNQRFSDTFCHIRQHSPLQSTKKQNLHLFTQLKTKLAIIAILFTFISSANAQEVTTNPPTLRCYSDQIHQEKMANDPVYEKRFIEKQTRYREYVISQVGVPRELCENPVKLPMAVHYQGVGSPDAACLIALAQDQIQILNDDYQGLNADISNWDNNASSFFPGVSNGETCVEFCLATQNHPAGYGLVNGDLAVTINAFTGDFNADWSGYINIFVRNINFLGYSPLGGDGDGDGVTVDNNAFGSGSGCSGVVPGSPYNLGRTLTHELGHYMNLGHIWGNGCANDDGVADTPNSNEEYYGCPALGVQSCGNNDMHMNYMDYTNDACMYMFSAGQSTRMENYTASNLTGVSGNSDVCVEPAPAISFSSSSTNVTEGTSNCNTSGSRDIDISLTIGQAPSQNAVVSFLTSGTMNNGNDFTISPSSVTFPAGQTDDQIVTVTIYEDADSESDETLEISYTINANGGDAEAGESNQTHTVTATNDDTPPSVGGTVNVIEQNFDGGLDGWTITDGGSTSDTWELASASGGLDGSQYIIVDSDAAGNNSTMDEELYSTVFDGTSVTGLTLDFDQYINIYAANGDFNETFDIDIWNGSSWQNIFSWAEADGDIGTFGAPDHQTIDISAHAATDNQLRFTYVAEWDYWWALDNIVVSGIGTTEIQMADNATSGSVDYTFGPMSTVHFYDEVTGNIMMTLVNNSNHDYGCTHVEVDRGANTPPGATASSAPESEWLTDKTYRVIPEFNNPSGNYTISLYYTADEINGWVAESGEPADDLAIVKSENAIDGASFLEISPATVDPFGSDFIYTGTFSSGFSGFALGGAPNPLPVELVDISATAKEDEGAIAVNWTTASELNNEGFEVLRRADDENDFVKIDWVDGMGTTAELNHYQLIDKQVRPGVVYYYQLKQIDFDGKNSLTKVVSAQLDSRDTKVDIYPNPAQGVLYMDIASPLDGTYSIVQADGKLVTEGIFESGTQHLVLDMKTYARGVYFVMIGTEYEKMVQRVVLR